MNDLLTSSGRVSSTAPPVDPEAIAQLRAALHGQVITAAEADYDRARAVWNGMIDRYPALIVSCATVDDVVTALHFARQHQLLIAVRGGGHSVAGLSTCDGGMVIDLSPLKEIAVDPEERLAHAGAGVTWGELDAAMQTYGLATPGGVFSRTGIAGLTLGRFQRRHSVCRGAAALGCRLPGWHALLLEVAQPDASRRRGDRSPCRPRAPAALATDHDRPLACWRRGQAGERGEQRIPRP